MKWLPQDLASFVWGLVLAAIVMVSTGFLREAGKELWTLLKKKYFPSPAPEPEPVQVDLQFKPTLYAGNDCLWSRHESVSRRVGEGFTFYPHPTTGGKIVRGYGRETSYLMVKPNAQKL
jgi:hypothetical protein